MNKKVSSLLLGLTMMGTAAYGFEGSFQHEFRHEEKSNTLDQLEWTLAKGYVKVNDKLRFDFDIDRDQFLENQSKVYDGWDTDWGVNYRVTSFDFLGKKWNYDQYVGLSWDSTDKEGSYKSTKENYYVAPRFNAMVSDWTWFQIDPRFTRDNVDNDYFLELRLQAATNWGNGWKNWVEVYNFIGQEEETHYAWVEDYLTYTKQLGNTNFSFITDFAVEAYSLADSRKDGYVSVYVDPQIAYNLEVGDVTITPYTGYRMYEGDDDYEQFHVSLRVKTKF